jgi:hypothetical protein
VLTGPPTGCFADPAGNDALTGTHWVNGTQTLQSCIDGCAELNYSLAGVENGVGERELCSPLETQRRVLTSHADCWCGENFLGGQREPVALCSKPCPGGGNATCGAYQKMELFSTAEGASYTAAEYAASKAAGWQGMAALLFGRRSQMLSTHIQRHRLLCGRWRQHDLESVLFHFKLDGRGYLLHRLRSVRLQARGIGQRQS